MAKTSRYGKTLASIASRDTKTGIRESISQYSNALNYLIKAKGRSNGSLLRKYKGKSTAGARGAELGAELANFARLASEGLTKVGSGKEFNNPNLVRDLTRDMNNLTRNYVKKNKISESAFNSVDFKKGFEESVALNDAANMRGRLGSDIFTNSLSKVNVNVFDNLSMMSNEELLKKNYIRVPGFTRKDGSKVKSHIRKLK